MAVVDDSTSVDLSLLDKSYRLSCEPGQAPLLRQAAEELDRRLREMRNAHAGLGAEKAAMMVGLQAMFELLEQKAMSSVDVSEVQLRVGQLDKRLDRCFFEQESLF
jgi:cell division protein ZapA